ncbi:MAG: hemerythrin domain-containing protein [Bacteroidales bacterium]|nr:hemerythrin domain-containing protein [Bacteroidales bacterium]
MSLQNHYTSSTKLIDVILDNSNIIVVLERMGIPLGFGEVRIDEICKKHGMRPEFFLMLCDVYLDPNHIPDVTVLNEDDLPHILYYLQTSHDYYTKKQFPELQTKIETTVDVLQTQHKEILTHFYHEYQEEAFRHFAYEESVVFPYIKQMIATDDEGRKSYSINQFSENHTDIDSKLHDLKCIFIKYIPSTSYSWDLLHSIFHLEDDLLRHTLVEDKMLIPLVQRLEKKK